MEAVTPSTPDTLRVTLELQDTWDQRTSAGDNVPPGTYAVRGEVLTEGEPLVTPSRTLRIRP